MRYTNPGFTYLLTFLLTYFHTCVIETSDFRMILDDIEGRHLNYLKLFWMQHLNNV